jgi:hypothetical protein
MTTQDVFEYPGSGKDWKEHLENNITDVETSIIFQTTSKKEFSDTGRYYSKLWNIVGAMDDYGNKIWANKIPETGGGPGWAGGESHILKDPSIKAKMIAAINSPECIEKKSKGFAEAVKNGTHNTQTKWHCIHCGLSGRGDGNYRWHGDNCLSNPNLSDSEKKIRKEKSNNNPMKMPEIVDKFRDKNLYCFEDIKTGKVKIMSRKEFVDKYGCKSCQVTAIIKNKNKSLYGWRVTGICQK